MVLFLTVSASAKNADTQHRKSVVMFNAVMGQLTVKANDSEQENNEEVCLCDNVVNVQLWVLCCLSVGYVIYIKQISVQLKYLSYLLSRRTTVLPHCLITVQSTISILIHIDYAKPLSLPMRHATYFA